jgi:transglutaminase-like putative cysteine protease
MNEKLLFFYRAFRNVNRFLYRFRYLLCPIISTLCPLRAQTTAPQQHLEITGSHRLLLIYDFTTRWPNESGCSAVFHLPIPPNTGAQTIEHFSSSLAGERETDDADPPQHFLTATLHHDQGDDRELHWQVRIVGVFQTRQLVDGPPRLSVSRPAPGQFLASTDSINWDTDTFQDWLTRADLRRNSGESAVGYGKRLFTYLRENGEYDYPPETAWNAAAGCRRLHTDCGGFSLIFVAACRANKIPARLLVGQWFKTRETAGGSLDLTGRQAHVISEFFDPRIGWIPEDLSSTLLRVRGFADTDFFGRDPGYFFAWHDGTDYHFAVPQNPAERVQWIQNPSLWFSANAGEAAESSSHDWTFRTLGR